jgi:hypothetical protein
VTADADQHQLTSTPAAGLSEPPAWEQRLRTALMLGAFVLVLIAGIADGNLFGVHLSGAPKRLADTLVIAGFVPVMLIGIIVILRAVRRLPPPHRLLTWGMSLLIVGLFLATLSFPWLYVDFSDLLPGWHLSHLQAVVVAALLGATFILWSIGAVFLCVAFIREVWQRVRFGHRLPPATPNV